MISDQYPKVKQYFFHHDRFGSEKLNNFPKTTELTVKQESDFKGWIFPSTTRGHFKSRMTCSENPRRASGVCLSSGCQTREWPGVKNWRALDGNQSSSNPLGPRKAGFQSSSIVFHLVCGGRIAVPRGISQAGEGSPMAALRSALSLFSYSDFLKRVGETKHTGEDSIYLHNNFTI